MIDHKTLKQLDITGKYLVKLLSSVLHEKEVPPLPSNLNWNSVFSMAKLHSVEIMAFYGAEAFIKDNTNLYNKWKRCKDANIAQNLIQEEARNEIFHSLNESNIRFLPLKGFELKQLYKRPEFRQMSDIDILIDPENINEIDSLMRDLGYQRFENFRPYHDEYKKPPCITIEFHKQMLSASNPMQEYYKDIWSKAIPDKKIPGSWRLTHEDFFVFQIVHLWKHYGVAGSGIRSMMDIYVYLDKFKSKLNWEYINHELSKLGLYDFFVKMESLSNFWFSDSIEKKHNIKDISKLQRRMFFSGAYGSNESRRFNEMDAAQVEKGSLQKMLYIFKRIFNRQALEYSYPILKRLPVLLPFLGLYRLIYAFFFKKSIIKTELELLRAKSKNE